MIFKNLTDVEVPARIRQVKAEHDAKIVRGRETAFDALLDSDLPEHEKSLDRLSGEAAVFLIAGSTSTQTRHPKLNSPLPHRESIDHSPLAHTQEGLNRMCCC